VIVSPLKWRYIRNWDPIDSKYYSLGWRIYLYKGRKIIYHGGYVTGYRAEIAFCPEENVGIAFLQNSPNHTAAVCVPEFFNRWFIQTDSIAADTVRHIPLTGHVF
jgi:beta-lactamase class C